MENKFEKVNKERIYKKIESDLPTFDGNKRKIKITLESDGYPKALGFFDIDGVLGNFKDMHGEAIKKLYPDHDPEEVVEEFFRGISLGTTYRVHNRMIKIYEEGKVEFKDTEVYMEWFLKNKEEVDESGPAHDKAAEYSMRHSRISAQIAEELYEKDSSSFEKTKILPVFHLAKLYKRMGIPLAVMTANDEPFAKSICKCLGLADSFITMASQKDFEGRGKEGAMEVLVENMKSKGIPVPKKLIVVGDSLYGDIGSGAVFQKEHKDFEVAGVFITEEDAGEMKKKISADPQLKDIPVEVLDPDKITKDEAGRFQLAKFRKDYGTK